MIRQPSQQLRCDGCIPPSRQCEKEKVETEARKAETRAIQNRRSYHAIFHLCHLLFVSTSAVKTASQIIIDSCIWRTAVIVWQSGNKHGSHAEIPFLHSCHSFQVLNYSLCPLMVEMSQECSATDRQTLRLPEPVAVVHVRWCNTCRYLVLLLFSDECILNHRSNYRWFLSVIYDSTGLLSILFNNQLWSHCNSALCLIAEL